MMRDFHVEEVLVPSFEDLEDDDVLIDFVDQGALITVMGPGKLGPPFSISKLISFRFREYFALRALFFFLLLTGLD